MSIGKRCLLKKEPFIVQTSVTQASHGQIIKEHVNPFILKVWGARILYNSRWELQPERENSLQPKTT